MPMEALVAFTQNLTEHDPLWAGTRPDPTFFDAYFSFVKTVS
jgi:hypothetical protein